MADEIRRSGRATKGQHTKNDETPEPKKKKGGRPKKQPDPEPEPEDEGPAIIRCVCGYVEEDENDTDPMICCDNCSAWQHNVCMGMPTDDDELPEKYYCEQCKPKDHKELLAGIAKGEKPWLDRQAEYKRQEEEERARKKKGGKKGKKAKATAAVAATAEKEASQPAAPEPIKSPTVESKPEIGQKRKTPTDISVDTSSPAASSSKIRKVSTPKETAPKSATGRKPSIATPIRKESTVAIQTELVENIADLQNSSRQRAAKALERLFVEQTKTAKQQGTFKQAGGQSSEEFGLKLALKVEYALYLNLWGHGSEPNPQYGEKMRMMLHNVKANPTLRDRLLNGFLSANNFTQMDSFQMASKEKQAETAQIMKETEKQHIIVQEDGPRIRRTHKGDEIIGDDSHHLTGEALASNAPRRRESEIEHDGDNNDEDNGPQSPNNVELPDDIKSPTSARPLTVDTKTKPPTQRKSSSNFDIQNVWSNVDSPNANSKQHGNFPPPSANGPSGVKADPEIDSLLKDEEDEEPYSPMDYVMEPGTVWRGSILMPIVADFRASAKFVAGFDPSPVHLWDHLMPSQLSIEGRIDTQKASSYLCGLQWSKTTNVTVVSITPAEADHDRAQFDKLFAYFTARKRYGVINKNPVALVRDTYVVPIEAGDAQRPEFIELLEHCDVPATGRPTRSLLIVYVIKVRTDNAPLPGSATATPRQPKFTAGSPVGGLPQHMSPIQGGFATPGQAAPPAFSPQPSAQVPQPSPGADPATGTKGWAAAQAVLGPELLNAPALAELIQHAPETKPSEFRIIKDVMERLPHTRMDLGQLMEALRQQL